MCKQNKYAITSKNFRDLFTSTASVVENNHYIFVYVQKVLRKSKLMVNKKGEKEEWNRTQRFCLELATGMT